MFVYTSIKSFATVCHFIPIRYEYYIIVLRSGLIGDKVPRFQLVVRGTDEKVLEAYAMKNYMVEVHQIPAQKIIMVDQSMNDVKIWHF